MINLFRHIFANRLKCIVRSKETMFWTLLYPMILALFFNLAFSRLNSNGNFQSFPIAVVDNAAYRNDRAFQSALQSVSADSENSETRLFHIKLATESEAEEYLRNGQIRGYVLLDEGGAHVVVRESGIQQTILKSFMDNYLQVASAYKTIHALDPARAQFILYEGGREFIEAAASNDRPADTGVVNYYALISMAVLFGGFLGKKEVDDIRADLSSCGARMNLAPVPKMKSFACSMCAAFLIQFVSLLILVVFLALALKIDFGGQAGLILLLCFVGSATGVSYGAFIGTFFKGTKGLAALICVSLLLSSASGLQFASVKYIITHNIPILAYVNPANLITDALYSLYYYSTYSRYFLNIGLLGAFTLLFFSATVAVTRRQKYASL